MNEWGAINEFWNSFGVPAFDENTTPDVNDKPEYPYITYEMSIGYLDDTVNLSASLWDYSKSWGTLSAIVEKISKKLGRGGAIVPFDGGVLVINRGTPFAQRASFQELDMIRRIFINIQVQFLTNR